PSGGATPANGRTYVLATSALHASATRGARGHGVVGRIGPRLRQYRRVGGRGAGGRLAIAVRRRGQQQLHLQGGRRGAEAAMESFGEGQPVRVAGARGGRLPRG